MKFKSLIAAALLTFAVSATAQDAVFGIKSGIVTTEMDMMGQPMTQKLYFDDFGKKQVTVSDFGGGQMRMLQQDGAQIMINDAEKTATRMPAFGMMGGGAQINFNNLTDEVKAQNNIKELGEETIAGKACKKYSITTEGMMGEQTRTVWIYKGITMKSSTSMGDMGEMVQTVTKLEEDATIDAAMFTVPAGVEIQEFDMSQFGGGF